MMFRHPEIYKTGIAIASSANQLYYDTIYQERYMGLPDHNKEGYKNGSPITFAHQLEGNLLIIHGTADDNVHYQNSLALIDKLVKHDKMFSTMIYPNCNHSLKTEDGDVLNHLFNTMTCYLLKNMPPVVQ
jgi:dipeptidyl-peptidase-4